MCAIVLLGKAWGMALAGHRSGPEDFVVGGVSGLVQIDREGMDMKSNGAN